MNDNLSVHRSAKSENAPLAHESRNERYSTRSVSGRNEWLPSIALDQVKLDQLRFCYPFWREDGRLGECRGHVVLDFGVACLHCSWSSSKSKRIRQSTATNSLVSKLLELGDRLCWGLVLIDQWFCRKLVLVTFACLRAALSHDYNFSSPFFGRWQWEEGSISTNLPTALRNKS